MAKKHKDTEPVAPPASIEMWSLEKLTHYVRDPRKNDHVVDRMVSSIKEFGFKIPVLAKSDGSVIDGHLRLKAAKKAGITEVPVMLCDEWTDAQVKAFRLLVNKSVAWAEWDNDLLALELEELKDADYDLLLTGFDEDEIAALSGGEGSETTAATLEQEEARKTLSERFLVPPFSVLDARQGYWQERKRAWLALGIKSEVGRGGLNQEDRHDQPATTETNGAAMEQVSRSKMALHNDPMQRKRKYGN